MNSDRDIKVKVNFNSHLLDGSSSLSWTHRIVPGQLWVGWAALRIRPIYRLILDGLSWGDWVLPHVVSQPLADKPLFVHTTAGQGSERVGSC